MKFCKTFVQGLSEIENLEEYTDLKCLWLENNCIKTIKGLDHLSLLKCLFLHHNRIEHITVKVLTFDNTLFSKSQGLSNLTALVNLNLSNNFISKLTNLAHLPNLHTFSVSRLELLQVDTDHES